MRTDGVRGPHTCTPSTAKNALEVQGEINTGRPEPAPARFACKGPESPAADMPVSSAAADRDGGLRRGA
jgi:hypothetical protein